MLPRLLSREIGQKCRIRPANRKGTWKRAHQVFDFDAGSRPKDRDDQELLAAAVTACFSDALMTPNGCRTCDRHELARCSFAFLIGLTGSASLIAAISAENAELSKDNRKGTCKQATQCSRSSALSREGVGS
jgi:hypothetical protein